MKGSHTLHFKYNGVTTLFVKILGEEGGRLGYCPEGDSSGGDHLSNDEGHGGGGILGGELALGNGRDTFSNNGTSSEDGKPPCGCSWVKEEEDTG